MSKPMLLCHTRSVKTSELKVLNKFLHVLQFDPTLNASKPLVTLPFEVVLLDIRNSKVREYLGQNIRDYDAKDQKVYWLRDPGDQLVTSDLGNIKYDFTIKSINTEAESKVDLLNSLRQVHIGQVEGKGMRFLKKLFSCVFGLVKS